MTKTNYSRPMRRVRFVAVICCGVLGVGIAAMTVTGALAAGASPLKQTATKSSSAKAQSVSSSSKWQYGKTLFDQSCSSCHGIDAQGSNLAPSLHGLGAGTVDLWVSSGWMPLANPGPDLEPARKPAEFDTKGAVAIANYVASLSPGGMPIPNENLANASVSEGFSIFSLNCAPCHTITGAGDALSNGLYAPPLHGLTATQVEEAVRSGPNNMPAFGKGVISKSQMKSLVAYVTGYIERPTNPGGLGLGGVGPVAEGFIGLFIGVGLCLLVALWIGDRTEVDESKENHGSHHENAGEVAEQGAVHA